MAHAALATVADRANTAVRVTGAAIADRHVAALAGVGGAIVLCASGIAGRVTGHHGLGVYLALVGQGGLVAEQGAVAEVAVLLAGAVGVLAASASVRSACAFAGRAHVAGGAAIAVVATGAVDAVATTGGRHTGFRRAGVAVVA